MGFGYAVYFTERARNRVIRWEPDTGNADVVAGEPKNGETSQRLASPYGLAFDQDGHLLIADKLRHRICRLKNGRLEALAYHDPDGHRARRPGNHPNYSPNPICPAGILLEREGTLLCSFADDNTIYRIHPDGRLELLLGTVGNRVHPPLESPIEKVPLAQLPNLPLRWPVGLVKRSDGTVFFIERRSQWVREYHPQRGVTSIFPRPLYIQCFRAKEAPPQGLTREYHPAHPGSLALDLEENLYMTDSTHACILKIDVARGTFRRVLQLSSTGRASGPAALAFGPDETAWVLNSSSGTIQGYQTKGKDWIPTREKLDLFRGRTLVLPKSGSGIVLGA